jgi:hypothetical protein
MLKLNREFVRQWRAEPSPSRPPPVSVSYLEEVTLGDDWQLEVTSVPYTTPEAVCRVRLLDLAGETVREFAPVDLSRTQVQARALRLETPGLGGPREMRVQAAVGLAAAEPVWFELYPLVVRPGGMRGWRTVRFDLGDLFPGASLQSEVTPDGTLLTASFRGWSWWGRAELLRNGEEIASQDIAKFGPVQTSIPFLVKPAERRRARDLFVVRLTRHDRRFVYTVPVVLGDHGGEAVSLPVLVRGTDFDEGWGQPNWRSPWRLAEPEIRVVAVPAGEVWRVVLPLDRDSGDECLDSGGWQVRARRGVADPYGRIVASLQPAWVNDARRTYLRFDGQDDNVTFPFRALPPGALTAEFVLRPAQTAAGTLFSDQNGGLDVRFDEQGRVTVQRCAVRLLAEPPLLSGQWHHLAVVYDYRELCLYQNGELVARAPAPALFRGINSRPVLGGLCREGRPLTDPFAGDLSGFALSARPLAPAEFVLARAQREAKSPVL